jgi:hypothetical protein
VALPWVLLSLEMGTTRPFVYTNFCLAMDTPIQGTINGYFRGAGQNAGKRTRQHQKEVRRN